VTQSAILGWLPNWLTGFVAQEGWRIRIVRLADGAVVRTLEIPNVPWDEMPTRFLPDGSFCTIRTIDQSDKAHIIAVERWSQEPPTPWWMLLISVAGICTIGWDVRCGFRKEPCTK